MDATVTVNDLPKLIKTLETKGFIIAGHPRIQLTEDGVYINFMTNIGNHPDIIAFPFDIFIPVSKELLPKETPDEKAEPKPEPAANAGKSLEPATVPEVVPDGISGGSPGFSDGSGSSIIDRSGIGDAIQQITCG